MLPAAAYVVLLGVLAVGVTVLAFTVFIPHIHTTQTNVAALRGGDSYSGNNFTPKPVPVKPVDPLADTYLHAVCPGCCFASADGNCHPFGPSVVGAVYHGRAACEAYIAANLASKRARFGTNTLQFWCSTSNHDAESVPPGTP